ncbi:MAG: helix-turn-helix domain-containing protein, partial [Calditrichota bacterium]
MRKRAVNAVLEGVPQVEIVKLFGISKSGLNKWLNRYRQGGIKALSTKKRGHRGHIKLKPWQAALTVRLIQDRLPDQLKLPFFLWTREAVAQLI